MVSSSTTEAVQAGEKAYDYVIIGGGTAGLTLAARLTEDPSIYVAVLEAGEARLEDPHILIPGLMSTLYGDDKYDWNFKTTPQEHLNNRIIAWPRGKVLGGTSAINFLMVSHASRVDLDNWEKLGNRNWNFETLEPYYRKAETFNAPSTATAKALHTEKDDVSLHGNSGPVQTTYPQGTGVLDSAWAPTFDNLGLGIENDPRQGATLGGYSLLKFMDKSARRSYAAPAYYVPNAERSNLTVITNAFVKRIDFKLTKHGNTAAGVDYAVAGQDYFVATRGEVILSAGSIQSPQILELSGIGSKSLLEKFGIDVVVDNPHVGENLQDHPLLGLSYEVNDGIPTAAMMKQPGVLDWAIQEWTEKGAGPLATGVSGTGFFSYSSVLPPKLQESLEQRVSKLVAQDSISSNPGLAKQLQLQKELLLNEHEADIQYNFGASGTNPNSGDNIANFFNHSDPGGYAGIVSVLTHAFSRGYVHIQSSDPETHPIIDPRYMSHPIDLEVLSDGMLFTQKISETKPLADLFKNNAAGDGKKILPSFKVDGRLTKEAAIKIIKNSVVSSFHPVGTCSMLPREDGGVVDSTLKVYGTENVRVVDASIAPLNVRGNIASLVYAIAERAADIIKEERKMVV